MKDVPDVAPSAGAWIEIPYSWTGNMEVQVAPSAGAWIEILEIKGKIFDAPRRSLRGSVD